jgi:hypothetical protein
VDAEPLWECWRAETSEPVQASLVLALGLIDPTAAEPTHELGTWAASQQCDARRPAPPRIVPPVAAALDDPDPGVRDQAIDAPPVVADLHPAGVGIDGGEQVQVCRSRDPRQDDVSGLHRRRVNRSDGYQLTAADKRDRGGAARAKPPLFQVNQAYRPAASTW